MIRNRPTPAGRALGRELARLVDEAEPRARLVEPAISPRCASCAFRAGPHVANGSETTLGDALKCALEGVPFLCHEPARAGRECSGWRMLQLADPTPPGRAPWEFSDEPEGGDATTETASEYARGDARQAEPASADQGAFAFEPGPTPGQRQPETSP